MNLNESISQMVNTNGTTMLGLDVQTLLIIMVIVIILQGLAMWKAAERKEKIWFWALLITSSVGILPAIYLYLRRKK
jgi:hypothetical protein